MGKICSGIIEGTVIARTFVTKDFTCSTFLGDSVQMLETFGGKRVRWKGAASVDRWAS